MPSAQLILALHAHQPVGNPDEVIRRAYDRAYRPFLDAVAKHAHLRLALHLSGPLLDWLERNQPAFLTDVRELASRGQIELLGGGIEEPILSSIPERDALGQLASMNARVAALFGSQPRGVWLAERVWEPELPRILNAVGAKLTFVDDAHLRAAGVEGELRGYHVAEKAGAPVALFPISRALRSLIPFGAVRDVVRALREAGESTLPGGNGVVFGDDLEKFGLWPDSHAWCYERGKLDELFGALKELSDEVELVPPSEYLARFPPQGRAYVPSCSYDELAQWALTPSRAKRTAQLRDDLPKSSDAELLRGGAWSQFLTRYPEANALHKRMLQTSQKLAEAASEHGADNDRLLQARAELYRGQCNDAYWHGAFGGLYLPHLRKALYAALIRADNLIDSETRGEGDFIEYDEDDLDADLRDEALLANAQVAARVKPDQGGVLTELDFRPLASCLTHVMSRREEAYHSELREQGDRTPEVDPDAPPRPLGSGSREPGLAARLVDDGYPRFSFIDRFHADGFGLEQLERGTDGDVGDFPRRSYAIEASGVDEDGDLSASVTLVCDGKLMTDAGPRSLLVEKTFHVPIDAPRLDAEYILENQSDSALTFTFAPELNFTLLSGALPERYIQLPDGTRAALDARKNHGALGNFSLIDEAQGIAVELSVDRNVELWSYPVETVNRSEAGFERTYQGTCFLLRMPITLPPGESARLMVKIELAKVEMEAEEEPAPEPPPAPPETPGEPTPTA